MAQPGRFRIPKMLEVALLYTLIYMFVKFGVTKLSVPLPSSVLMTYMAITLICLFLYTSSREDYWQDFLRPILSILRGESRLEKVSRMGVFAALPALVGYGLFNAMLPKFEAPFEIRVVHPSPPANVRVHGNLFNLQTAQNPFRTDDGKYAAGLEKKYGDPQFAADMWLKDEKDIPPYLRAVKAGGIVFFKNCFICHGDGLDGRGMFAEAFNPIPANFQDAGTISQLQETFVLWRVSKGGPGLPRESTPWSSAMPIWENMLTMDQIWQAIAFEYWYTGFFPRTWEGL